MHHFQMQIRMSLVVIMTMAVMVNAVMDFTTFLFILEWW